MNFYKIGPRDDYAGYLPSGTSGFVSEPRMPEYCREKKEGLTEYLGEPRRKPGKHGDLHITDSWYFFRDSALPLVSQAARGKVVTNNIVAAGRDGEKFLQVWVVNYVDCLDIASSNISERLRKDPLLVGVIRRAAFDVSRWDGSDLFVVPQDPNYNLYCSERFVSQWQAAKLKGAKFSRYLFDPDAIYC